MDAEIKTEFSAVRADIHEVDARFSAEIRWVETTVRQETREEGIATRRHFDVVAESLRDDIRIIAEGLIALDAKVETIR
jgi:putative N-acetylmannosamine-6-phosphate epimerase